MDFKFKIFCLSISVFTKSSQAQVTNSLSLAQLAWDVSERSQSNLHWERHLRDPLETSQKRWLFCDALKTSQIHLKKDVFFVTSLRRLEHISKKMSFPWRLWEYFWFFKNTPQKRFRVISVGLLQYLIK